MALFALSACTDVGDGPATSVGPQDTREASATAPTTTPVPSTEFEAQFDAFTDDVAERFPDRFVGAALRSDTTEGCVFLTEADPPARESISAMAEGLAGDVCIATAPSDSQEISDLLDRVGQRLERLTPEAEITSGYRRSDHTLLVDIHNLGDLAFDPAFKQQVDEELFGLAPTVRVRTYRDPFPLEGENSGTA